MNVLLRRLISVVVLLLISALALASIAPLFLITRDILASGVEAIARIGPAFFTALPPSPNDATGGVGPALVGTLFMSALASLLGFAVGFPVGVYIGEYRHELAAKIARINVNVLVEFPTITIGLYVYAISESVAPSLDRSLSPFLQWASGVPVLGYFLGPISVFNAYAGAAALTLIMVPYVALFTASAYSSAERNLREAAYAIAGDERKALFVVMRKALGRSVLTAFLLGSAKVAGETAPLLFTSAFNDFYGPFTQYTASIPVLIYRFATTPFPIYKEVAYGAAAVLLLIVFALFISARALSRHA
ncbi:MAG: PstA family ABC transporter permease [Thermoproteus sp.]